VSSPSAVSWINLIKVVFSRRTKEQNCFKQSHNLVRAFRLNTATNRPLEFGLRRCWKDMFGVYFYFFTHKILKTYMSSTIKLKSSCPMAIIHLNLQSNSFGHCTVIIKDLRCNSISKVISYLRYLRCQSSVIRIWFQRDVSICNWI
jgi:hypothetical protein